jgi:hypothetical protein
MKSTSQYSSVQRIFISIGSFFMFSIFGVIVRAFVGPVSLLPVTAMLKDLLPVTLGFGLTAGVLAFIFPKVFSIVLRFFPFIDGSS